MTMPAPAPAADPDPRLGTLLDLTPIPTASGREGRVVRFIERWAQARPWLAFTRDPAGNLVIQAREAKPSPTPLFITGHLDHPAFVVERVLAPGVVEVSFRGGVMDVFFEDAPVTLYDERDAPYAARLTGLASTSSPAGKHYVAEVEGAPRGAGANLRVGDVGTWTLPGAEIDAQGLLHTPCCDDLAAVAAALEAMSALFPTAEAARAGGGAPDVRLLFTLAEEIGFIGAIAACKHQTMPKGSRVLALENSRAFPDSPVGGGPIVRVGDRLSVFTPWLTAACAARAEQAFGGAAQPRASQTSAQASPRPWQRKLMAGGACEASVFCHAGYDATCLCLPLGNYHNMPHLAELQGGVYDRAALGPPRAAREFIHTQDYLGLIDLLVALGRTPPEAADSGVGKMTERLWNERKYVLGA